MPAGVAISASRPLRHFTRCMKPCMPPLTKWGIPASSKASFDSLSPLSQIAKTGLLRQPPRRCARTASTSARAASAGRETAVGQ